MLAKSVTLKDIIKKFPTPQKREEVIAVNKVSFLVKEGELVTLLGPSGCGKTTALRIISGFEYPDEGEVYIGDELVNNIPPNKRDASMVFQTYALFPHLTIYENIAYGLRINKFPQSKIKEKVKEILEKVGLTGVENRHPGQLSGGQQQRVALARALVREPKVLLFDEPLSNLDAKLRESMRKEIKQIQRRLGITSIYVTHDQIEAMTLSDRIVVMNQGKIEQIGTPTQIYEKPQSKFVADFIGKANFLTVKIVETKEKYVKIKIKDKELTLPANGEDWQKEEKCIVVARPETVELTEVQDEELTGDILRVIYLGDRVEYEVEFEGNILYLTVTNPRAKKIFAEKEKVSIKFNPSTLHLLKTDEE